MNKKILIPILALAALFTSAIIGNKISAHQQEDVSKTSYIENISSSTFKRDIAKGVVMVDFWAPWCGPCRKMNPILEELSVEYKDKAKIAKMNVDDNKKLASQLGIQSIPHMIFYKDGKEVTRVVGQVSKEELKKVIDEVISKKQS